MIERRREIRMPTMGPIVVDLGDCQQRAGVTEDVSDSGARLRTTVPIALGTPVKVRFYSEESGQAIDNYGVVVRHCEPASSSLFSHSVGVRFAVSEPVSTAMAA